MTSELKAEDLEIGSGPGVKGPGQFITVHYTGWLADGTEFDSSHARDEPFGFPLGVGYVIPGWDQGVIGMRVGRLVPPKATLVFEIEILELSE